MQSNVKRAAECLVGLNGVLRRVKPTAGPGVLGPFAKHRPIGGKPGTRAGRENGSPPCPK
jgi:hypothetical protein